jgi:hypothetical protein
LVDSGLYSVTIIRLVYGGLDVKNTVTFER